jgi:membrane fusion protein (multidrug efflux system)
MVDVDEITLEDANKPEKYIGHVEAIESVNLRAQVQGYLDRLNFKEGSHVREGQLLYVIDQSPYKARVDSAQAKVTQAEANLFKARTRLKRLRSAPEESVSQMDIDDAIAARDLAQGQLEEARANLGLARIDLNYSTIEAPIEGRIGKSFYKKGDLVGPAAGSLAEVVQINPIRVVFSVPESQISSIQDTSSEKKALKVRIQTPGKESFSREGAVEFIDNNVDSKIGSIAVWARFENPKGKLVPGEYVNVFMRSAKADMYPAVPQVAVQRDQEGAFVYVLGTGNQVEKRRIKTGKTIKDKYIVRSGLDKGEKVIVQGIQKVSPGMSVKISPAVKEDN